MASISIRTKEGIAFGGVESREMVAIDDALNEFAEIDPSKAKVVELRFFGELSVDETAEVLKISPQSVMRDRKMARAWLFAELNRSTTLPQRARNPRPHPRPTPVPRSTYEAVKRDRSRARRMPMPGQATS